MNRNFKPAILGRMFNSYPNAFLGASKLFWLYDAVEQAHVNFTYGPLDDLIYKGRPGTETKEQDAWEDN